MIRHYEGCSARYPEKPAGEAPRATTDIDLADGAVARVCNDCGASEIIPAAVVADSEEYVASLPD